MSENCKYLKTYLPYLWTLSRADFKARVVNHVSAYSLSMNLDSLQHRDIRIIGFLEVVLEASVTPHTRQHVCDCL